MSRRSITSAIVVPTASDENAGSLSDKAAADPFQIQEQVSQVVVAMSESQPTQVAATSPPTVYSGSEDSAVHQPLTAKPVKTRPISPLAIMHSAHQNEHATVKRVKNYRALVNSFKHMQPFARDPDGNYPVKTICVLCSALKPTSVFFPCQHMCVCNKCIASNDLSPDFSMSLERCVCPVCGVNIRIILPQTGNEEEEYWNWVLSTKPTLPSSFLKSFKSAGKMLSEDSVAESTRSSTIESTTPHGSADTATPFQRIITRPSRGKRPTHFKTLSGPQLQLVRAEKRVDTSMSRKSITSATVVPTVRDDRNDNLSYSTLDCNVGVSKEEVVATTPEHLIHAEAEETPQVTDESQGTKTEASNPPDTDEPPKDEQSFPPKPFPLPISHGMPHKVELTDRGGFKFVNNYRALATSFKHLQPFARCPDGTYSAEVTCLLCDQEKPTSVFFPCQHMSVCNNCIRANDMSPECSMNLERCVCPVCSADIDLILPHTGSEEDTYWKWVLATKPCLPSQFTKDFKSAVQKISDNSVMERRNSTIGAITLYRSDEQTQASKQPNRRRSWGPSYARRRSAYKLGASRKHESCMIL